MIGGVRNSPNNFNVRSGYRNGDRIVKFAHILFTVGGGTVMQKGAIMHRREARSKEKLAAGGTGAGT